MSITCQLCQLLTFERTEGYDKAEANAANADSQCYRPCDFCLSPMALLLASTKCASEECAKCHRRACLSMHTTTISFKRCTVQDHLRNESQTCSLTRLRGGSNNGSKEQEATEMQRCTFEWFRECVFKNFQTQLASPWLQVLRSRKLISTSGDVAIAARAATMARAWSSVFAVPRLASEEVFQRWSRNFLKSRNWPLMTFDDLCISCCRPHLAIFAVDFHCVGIGWMLIQIPLILYKTHAHCTMLRHAGWKTGHYFWLCLMLLFSLLLRSCSGSCLLLSFVIVVVAVGRFWLFALWNLVGNRDFSHGFGTEAHCVLIMVYL